MTRIQPLPARERGPIVRVALREARRRYGREPGPFAAVARHRPTFLSQIAVELAMERGRLVPPRLEELAMLKTAMIVGCEFCCDIGSFVARGMGATEDELRDLADHRASSRFDARDVAVLDLAEAMSRTPAEVDDALFDRLREFFDEAQLVELCSAIAWENYRARLNQAMGFEEEGFSEGSFCVRPQEGAARVPSAA